MGRIERSQYTTNVIIDPEKLRAHFRTLGTKDVAYVIRSRKTNR